ncbi:MAG: bifunctional riboflavin kinase/FAD synthetase, partial [Clostridiales bacterium]
FIGDIMQTPPAVCALKRDGVPVYKRLRRGEQIVMEPRPVHIEALRLLDFRPGVQAYAEIEISCGKGVYIRSLAHDLGALLGVGGHICRLTRLQVGRFMLEQAYTAEQVAAMAEAGDHSFLLPMQYPLAGLPQFTVTEAEQNTILYGNPLLTLSPSPPFALGLVQNQQGNLLALASLAPQDGGNLLRPLKVLAPAPPPKVKGYQAIAIGNFDGVHLGHRALLADLAEQKRLHGGKTAVLTFFPHPLQLICGQAPPLLNTEQQKKNLICDAYGVDDLIVLPFDRQLMNASPQEFFQRVLLDRLQVHSITVGYNFTFAAHGRGTAKTLVELGISANIPVKIVGEVLSKAGSISSSAIRHKLAAGDMTGVGEMLGYWYALEGTVIVGNRLGRTIGFPTANFFPAAGVALPPRGVYAAKITVCGYVYNGVVNFGIKPTIGGEHKPLVEAYLFDYKSDLYGTEITVALGKFLRPERRYANISQLQEQIERDSREASEFLSQLPVDCHLPKPIE